MVFHPVRPVTFEATSYDRSYVTKECKGDVFWLAKPFFCLTLCYIALWTSLKPKPPWPMDFLRRWGLSGSASTSMNGWLMCTHACTRSRRVSWVCKWGDIETPVRSDVWGGKKVLYHCFVWVNLCVWGFWLVLQHFLAAKSSSVQQFCFKRIQLIQKDSS